MMKLGFTGQIPLYGRRLGFAR